jgi:RNA polymerase sigma factor (sigma-70 family)
VYRALAATLFDGDLAADALQDAFLEGLRKPPAHEGNVAGWLFRVALRKAGRSRHRANRIAAAVDRSPGRPAPSLEDVLVRISVGQLLRLLTTRQRSIVVAYFYLDQTQDQIAQLLGLRRGTVAATIAQALARMRKGEGRVGPA